MGELPPLSVGPALGDSVATDVDLLQDTGWDSSGIAALPNCFPTFDSGLLTLSSDMPSSLATKGARAACIAIMTLLDECGPVLPLIPHGVDGHCTGLLRLEFPE